MKHCDTCGAIFETTNPLQVRCGDRACLLKYWRNKSKRRHYEKHGDDWGWRSCVDCGVKFHTGPYRQVKLPQRCGDCTKQRKRNLVTPTARKCAMCERNFEGTGLQRHCSAACSSLAKKIAWRRTKRRRVFDGKCAGHGNAGHCEPCHQRNFAKSARRRSPDGQRGPTKSKGAHRKICELQKWKCSLCGKKLNESFRHPHSYQQND